MPPLRARILISGDVQGVGFRYFAQDVADLLPVTGSVRNVPSGEVEIVVEGDRHAIDRLIAEVSEGPRFSRVSNVTVEWSRAEGRFTGFRIVR
jgi:acylphosphatase